MRKSQGPTESGARRAILARAGARCRGPFRRIRAPYARRIFLVAVRDRQDSDAPVEQGGGRKAIRPYKEATGGKGRIRDSFLRNQLGSDTDLLSQIRKRRRRILKPSLASVLCDDRAGGRELRSKPRVRLHDYARSGRPWTATSAK